MICISVISIANNRSFRCPKRGLLEKGGGGGGLEGGGGMSIFMSIRCSPSLLLKSLHTSGGNYKVGVLMGARIQAVLLCLPHCRFSDVSHLQANFPRWRLRKASTFPAPQAMNSRQHGELRHLRLLSIDPAVNEYRSFPGCSLSLAPWCQVPHRYSEEPERGSGRSPQRCAAGSGRGLCGTYTVQIGACQPVHHLV
jgi:hypothetical protein